MMTWLKRLQANPIMLDGLLALQISGSPVGALMALTAPILCASLAPTQKEH